MVLLLKRQSLLIDFVASLGLCLRMSTCYRINFSRVEWKVHVEGNAYVLGAKAGDGSCKWPCPSGCKQNPGDNWSDTSSLCLLRALSERVFWLRLWAPLGDVDVHQPEVRSTPSSYLRSVLRLLRGRPTFVCSLCSNA